MPRDGTATRTKIMDAAQTLVLDQGFAASSVDSVIEAAGITKGTFFYHFKTKSDLALALIDRYAAADAAHLDGDLARAEDLARDPLQQMLVFIGLLKEEMAGLNEPFPGCLYASFCYEAGLFDETTLSGISDALLYWRKKLSPKFQAIIENYPPRHPVEPNELTDLLLSIFEGSFIMGKSLKDPMISAVQLGHFRNYIELLFESQD